MLPATIEYLLAQFENGVPICWRGGYQVIIPVFPPGATIDYTVRPLSGVYAHLGWATRFGTDMVPNTISGVVRQWGSRIFTGSIT